MKIPFNVILNVVAFDAGEGTIIDGEVMRSREET